jgi:ankyrin repeat protein
MTSLTTACHEGHMTVVKWLLNNATLPYDVNTVTGVTCNTALHEVIWFTRESPLQVSSNRGDTAAVVDVVYDSNVNMQDIIGRTAMHWTCVNEHLDIMKILLSVFADVNITDDDGLTPVEVCKYGGNPELLNYIQHNHLMSVSSDNNDNNAGVADQTNHSTRTKRTGLVNKRRIYAHKLHYKKPYRMRYIFNIAFRKYVTICKVMRKLCLNN